MEKEKIKIEMKKIREELQENCKGITIITMRKMKV